MAPINQTSKADTAERGRRNRRLSECYQRAMHLSTCEKDFEYAHAMFAECVLQEPGNLQFVESMVENLRAKTPRPKKSMFKLNRGGSRPLTKAVQYKNWKDAFRVGVDLLSRNPWDVTALRAMANACAALHHNEVELVYLKQALDAEPKNIEVNRHCARSLGRMGQFDQAISCWHRIEKLAGHDEEATRMISTLAQEKFKYPGGRPPVSINRQTAADVEHRQTVEPQEPHRDIVLRPEQKLERAIAQDPQNLDNYLELAELLLSSTQYNLAESVLNRAISACGEQQSLVEKLRRVRHLRADEERRLNEKRGLAQKLANAPIRIPWLELLLASTFLVVLLQLVPSAGEAAWRIIDIRNWSWMGWLAFNIVVLTGLVVIRMTPTLRAHWLRRKVQRIYRTSRRNA